jgi:predicted Zn-dependent peptidase
MVTHTEVDGVETVLAPIPGPLRAGLMFRVGAADETLATVGITHLLEHLALHRQGLTDYHFNGATAATETHFVVEGTPEEVVSYLNGVCAALRDLPLDRLETEKEILRTEANGRHGDSPLPLWRYGAQGYGLSSYPEYGLHRITGPDLTAWAERWFTRQNAVLWITADEPPPGLDLKLPDGTRHPAPGATTALPHTPAYFTGEGSAVVLHAEVDRSTAAEAFAGVLGRVLFRELRQEGGLSYRAACDYAPRDARHAVITAVADALPAKRSALLGGFVDALAALRLGRIDQADLDSVRNRALEDLAKADTTTAGLGARARDLLLGHPAPDADAVRAELAALTLDDLRRVAVRVSESALLMTPAGTAADWAGLHPAPAGSADRVDGRRWPELGSPGHGLVIGEEGVSLVEADEQWTVRYAQCVAVLVRPDGARRLIGADGISVGIEPTLFGLPDTEIARIDALVPGEAVVPLPARRADRIPKPPANSGSAGARTGFWYGPIADRYAVLGEVLYSLAFLALVGAVATIGVDEGAISVGLAIGSVIAAGPPAVVRTVRRIHARRDRR